MRIIIVGAGISGLALAYRLKHHEVTVLEASAHVGGNIRTYQENGFTWEAGPNGFLDSKPATLNLAKELGLIPIAASEASRKNRYLCLNNQLVKLPGSPLGLLTTKALSWRGKLRLVSEPFIRRGDSTHESVHEFAVRRFGREAAEIIVDALVTGIHGGDPQQLSLPAAFPRLAKFEADGGSVWQGLRKSWRERRARGEVLKPPTMWSFAGGMQELTDALAAKFNVRRNEPVTTLARNENEWLVRTDRDYAADAVILTVPARVMATLLTPLDAGFRILKYIPTNRIAVVALGYDAASSPDGFGYIAPQNTKRNVLGVQWCSRIFPGRAPEGHVLWRALCGGVHRGDLLDLSDDELIRRVHEELQRVLPVHREPVFARVQRWPHAIPQYTRGHLDRVKQIDTLAAKYPGLCLAGNSLRGVAVNDCTEYASSLESRL